MLHLGAGPGTILRPKEMSANEALRRQLDELRLAKQTLEVENTRLREEHMDKTTLLELEKEKEEQARAIESLTEDNDRLKTPYEELVRDTQDKEDSRPHENQWENRYRELEEELQLVKDKSKLEHYRAVREERQKREEREQRWTKQLASLEQQLQLTERRSGSSGTSNPPPSSGISSCEFSINDCTSGIVTPTVSSVSVSTTAAASAPISSRSSTVCDTPRINSSLI